MPDWDFDGNGNTNGNGRSDRPAPPTFAIAMWLAGLVARGDYEAACDARDLLRRSGVRVPVVGSDLDLVTGLAVALPFAFGAPPGGRGVG